MTSLYAILRYILTYLIYPLNRNFLFKTFIHISKLTLYSFSLVKLYLFFNIKFLQSRSIEFAYIFVTIRMNVFSSTLPDSRNGPLYKRKNFAALLSIDQPMFSKTLSPTSNVYNFCSSLNFSEISSVKFHMRSLARLDFIPVGTMTFYVAILAIRSLHALSGCTGISGRTIVTPIDGILEKLKINPGHLLWWHLQYVQKSLPNSLITLSALSIALGPSDTRFIA